MLQEAGASFKGVREVSLLVAGFAAVLFIAGGAGAGAVGSAPVYGYTVVAVHPHDRGAFTEGLAYHRGYLIEGTGLKGASSLRRVVLATGRVVRKVELRAQYWGEGATVLRGQVYQVTWQDGTGFVYDEPGFRLLRTVAYTGEGWGLTNDGKSLIMSDGSDTLRFLDPATFAVRRTVTVHDGTTRVSGLNELELVKGLICANVYLADRVACADPATGAIRYWIDLTDLLPLALRRPDAALNGIAYDASHDRLFVTGKRWPRLYQIRAVAAGQGCTRICG
jgi:glutamine cyclotransferase